MTDLQQILTKPCLLEEVDGVIVAEPPKFISARSVYATARHKRQAKHFADIVQNDPFHSLPSKQGSQ